MQHSSSSFNPRFQGTWIVRHGPCYLCGYLSTTFNPRFQGTWIVSGHISMRFFFKNKPFNPRFQGTWIVRNHSKIFVTTTFKLSIPVFRGHGLLEIAYVTLKRRIHKSFNPRFQGTWIVSYPCGFQNLFSVANLSIPVFRGHGLLAHKGV